MILGANDNLAPTAIKKADDKGNTEMVTNPKKLANMFNNFFRNKVKKHENLFSDQLAVYAAIGCLTLLV